MVRGVARDALTTVSNIFNVLLAKYDGRFMGPLATETERAWINSDAWVVLKDGMVQVGLDDGVRDWRAQLVDIPPRIGDSFSAAERAFDHIPTELRDRIREAVDQYLDEQLRALNSGRRTPRGRWNPARSRSTPARSAPTSTAAICKASCARRRPGGGNRRPGLAFSGVSSVTGTGVCALTVYRRHPAGTGADMTDPVLIVGAGPTGLTAALELSRLGIAVRLIDAASAPATTSRAIGIQARTLELMQQRGLAAEMVRLGNPAGSASIYGGGKLVTRLDFGHVASRFNYLLFLSQAETERILRAAVEREGVRIEHGVALVGFAQDALSHDPSPVHAVLRHAGGTLERARAPWLISAEGAHSLVRATLDLPFEGRTLSESYALGDLHIAGDLAESDFHIFSSEHGFMGLFPMGRQRFRLIAGTPPETAHAEAPSLDALQAIYDQRSAIAARFHDMSWSSWFRINSRMVSRLRVGRLLLGGDSAHIHSPAGAQGMNTGIQDMINLGWKLALVMQGKAPESLLDTYEQDRLPVMRNVLAKTEGLTGLIGSENPLVRSLINHVGPWIGGVELVQANSTARMSQIALGYRDSPLSAEHPHGGALHAGERVPDLAVRRGGGSGWEDARLLELLDPSRFTLLVTQGSGTTALDADLLAEVGAWGATAGLVQVAPAEAAEARRAFQSAFGWNTGVFLVRPDGYVGVAAGEHSAVRQIAAYRARWLTVGA